MPICKEAKPFTLHHLCHRAFIARSKEIADNFYEISAMTRYGHGSKNKGRKCAFTLAEVLITLGIIGVVAALTLPTLIQNYKVKQTVTALKADYTIFENAFRMAVAEKGEISSWGIANLTGNFDGETGINNYDTEENIQSSKILFDSVKPYLNIIKTCEPEDNSCISIHEGKTNLNMKKLYSGILANGSSFYMYTRSSDCKFTNHSVTLNLCADLTIDVNGSDKGENEWGRDIFRFSITSNSIKPRGTANDTAFPFEEYCDTTKEALSVYREGCTGWVIQNENMDYLKCTDLSWDGKHTCK